MILNAQAAIIPVEKLRDYLLFLQHPVGRYKATYFASLGYTHESWELLEKDIREILAGAAELLETTEYGQKLAVRGNLTAPNGRMARVITVWIILNGQTTPRFVTA